MRYTKTGQEQKMKVVFLNPPYKNKKYSRDSRSPAITKSGTIYYPIWLSYAAGVLDETGDFNIRIIETGSRKWKISPEFYDI